MDLTILDAWTNIKTRQWNKLLAWSILVVCLCSIYAPNVATVFPVICLTAEHQPVVTKHNTKREILRPEHFTWSWTRPIICYRGVQGLGCCVYVSDGSRPCISAVANVNALHFILGPKTVFFWAPVFKWASYISYALKDFDVFLYVYDQKIKIPS